MGSSLSIQNTIPVKRKTLVVHVSSSAATKTDSTNSTTTLINSFSANRINVAQSVNEAFVVQNAIEAELLETLTSLCRSIAKGNTNCASITDAIVLDKNDAQVHIQLSQTYASLSKQVNSDRLMLLL